MRTLLSLLALTFASAARAADPPQLKVLFLSDCAGRKPADRFKQRQPVLAKRGIDLTYTDKGRTVLETRTESELKEPWTWFCGFTAASNISIYTARTCPREYRNRTAFIPEPTGHLTATMMLQPSASSFKAQFVWNLVASDDEWCAPIDAQAGPDGRMWVVDWYEFIVQHNPTP